MSGSVMGGFGVDPKIALAAGQGAQTNPLASTGDFARTLGAINQTKLQGQALQSGAMSLWQQQKQLAYGQIAPLVAQGRINDTGDLTSALANMEANGVVTAPFLKDMVDSLGQGGDFLSNLKAQTVAGTQPPEKAVAALAPSQTTVDQGLNRQPYLTPAPGMPGQGEPVPVGTPQPLGAPPSVQGSQVEWLDGNGVKQQGTFAQYNTLLGNGQVLGPARPVQVAPGTAQPGAPKQPMPAGYNGRFPAAPAAAPGLTSFAGPAPGTVEAANTSASQYAQDRAGAGSFATRVLPLKQAIGLLSDTDTGPGSETANHFRSVLISAANQGLLPKGVTPDQVSQANFDELKKYFAQYITGMPFAGGSDARMAEAVSGSPNTNMSTMANQQVAKVLVGMERYKAAQTLSFDQAAQQGQFGAAAQANPNAAAGQYANYAAKFNQATDPRAFAYDLMSPADRGKMIAKMTPEERTKYQTSLKAAYGLPGLMQ